MTPQEAGRPAEARAENHLLKNGGFTVHRNYSWKTGEIDLIMEKKDLLVFVEVRLRQNSDYGSGADSVNYPSKQKSSIRLNDIFRLSGINGRAIDSMLYQ